MHRILPALALTALALGQMTGPAQAQYTVLTNASQIQEDWQLVVAKGDPTFNGPQIMIYMSPVSDTSIPYAWLMLNVRDAPNPYSPGGNMIQVWDYSNNLITSCTNTANTAQLNTTNETITWTQQLALNKKTGQTSYDVIAANSKTWGDFSNALTPVTFNGPASMSGYDPNVSVKNSKVAWQADNVTSLSLLTVRQYDSDGKLLKTDNVNLPVNLTPR
jgi:hypothetical protein